MYLWNILYLQVGGCLTSHTVRHTTTTESARNRSVTKYWGTVAESQYGWTPCVFHTCIHAPSVTVSEATCCCTCRLAPPWSLVGTHWGSPAPSGTGAPVPCRAGGPSAGTSYACWRESSPTVLGVAQGCRGRREQRCWHTLRPKCGLYKQQSTCAHKSTHTTKRNTQGNSTIEELQLHTSPPDPSVYTHRPTCHPFFIHNSPPAPVHWWLPSSFPGCPSTWPAAGAGPLPSDQPPGLRGGRGSDVDGGSCWSAGRQPAADRRCTCPPHQGSPRWGERQSPTATGWHLCILWLTHTVTSCWNIWVFNTHPSCVLPT